MYLNIKCHGRYWKYYDFIGHAIHLLMGEEMHLKLQTVIVIFC